MNIDQNEFISCLRLIVSQRLLRKKCTKCDQGSIRSECECTDGYNGRFGVFEVLYFNESLKYHMIQNPYCNELTLIQNYQFTPINQQVMECIRYGITSPEEAKRALNIC